MSAKHHGTSPSRSRDAWIEKARGVPIESIAPPGLKRRGKYLVGPCPRCGGTDRFSIKPDKGMWSCRGCPRKANGKLAGGDAIDLIRHVRRCTFLEAVAFIDGGSSHRFTKLPTLVDGNRSAPSKQAYDAASLVRCIVAGLVPILGSPGERYLREARGIYTGAIADLLARTDAIGWNPAVFFREEGHPLDGQKLGAIIGIMTDPVTAQPTGAISRTYIDGNLRKIGKAKTLGTGRGIIRLSRDDEVEEGLHLAEGIETALSAAVSKRKFRPIWSVGSAPIMAAFPVLGGVETLTLLIDHDAAGERAARETEARWLEAGREVLIYRPKTPGHDFNDLIKGA
jgi:hypothetical protein